MDSLFESASPSDWTWKEWAIIGGALFLIFAIGIWIGVSRSKAKKKRRYGKEYARFAQQQQQSPLYQPRAYSNKERQLIDQLNRPNTQNRPLPALPSASGERLGYDKVPPMANEERVYDRVPTIQTNENYGVLPLPRDQAYGSRPVAPNRRAFAGYQKVPSNIQNRRGGYQPPSFQRTSDPATNYGSLPARATDGYGEIPKFRDEVDQDSSRDLSRDSTSSNMSLVDTSEFS